MQRIKWVDNLKAFTIVLVVLSHCFDGYVSAHIFKDTISPIMREALYSFHMPLFFAISGYTYYLSNKNIDYKPNYWLKPINFILIYVLWNFILLISSQIADIFVGSQINRPFQLAYLQHIWWKPVGFLWYIHALAIMYVFFYFLKRYNTRLLIIILFFVSSFIFSYPRLPYKHVIYHLLFFAIGGYMTEHSEILSNKNVKYVSFIGVCMTIILYQFRLNHLYFATLRIFLPITVIVFLFSAFRQHIDYKVGILTTISKYALPIYLLQNYGTAGTRIFLYLLIGERLLILYVLLGTFLGLYMPVIIGKYADKHEKLGYLFNPIKLLLN